MDAKPTQEQCRRAARRQRRAQARLAVLQGDLGRFRGNLYVAISHGDPGWIRRCHKAVREQQEKIERLRAELPGDVDMSA